MKPITGLEIQTEIYKAREDVKDPIEHDKLLKKIYIPFNTHIEYMRKVKESLEEIKSYISTKDFAGKKAVLVVEEHMRILL